MTYFEITRKANYKWNGEIWQLMGRIMEMHDEAFNVTMVYIDGCRKVKLIYSYWDLG